MSEKIVPREKLDPRTGEPLYELTAERTNVAPSNAELDSIEAWLRNLPDYENEFAYRPKGTVDAADAIRFLRAQLAERDADIDRANKFADDIEAGLSNTRDALRACEAERNALRTALKSLTDAPCSYAGTHIHIFCDSHSDAMRRMREARAAIASQREPAP